MEEVINNQIELDQNGIVNERPKNQSIIGVQLLRFYMAFLVVSTHLGGKLLLKWAGIFYVFQPFHVPVFMLLSFLLCSKYFLTPTKELIKKRLLRILIPFITWGILSYLLCMVLWPISFTTLLNQLLTGYPLNNALWYLAVMLWICILFWIIKAFTNRNVFLIIISIISIGCIVSQYTGLNYYLFNGLHDNVKYTIGRFFEMIPYATIGILLSTLAPYLDKVENKYRLIMFFGSGLLMAGIIAIRTYLVQYHVKGFDYAGAYLIVIAVLLVLTAYTNPINSVQNETFRCVIKWITSFTLGIFCMHIVIGRFVEWAFAKFNWPTYTTIMVVISYLICYLISFLIWLIPNKYAKQIVD